MARKPPARDAEAAFTAAMHKAREVTPRQKKRPSARMTRLALEQAAFEITENPVFAFRAISMCMRWGIALPGPVAKFLRHRVAGAFEVLSAKDALTEGKKIDALVERLWLRLGKSPFDNFDTVQRGFRLVSWMAMSRPNSGFLYQVKVDEKTRPGPEITRSDMIAMAKRAGIAPSKARDEIALANKIHKRAADILENRRQNSEK